MLARVSNLEAFRQWREREDQDVDDLVHWLTVDAPSEAMKAGTAFHKALEMAPDGEHDVLYANGYAFQLPDATLVLPTIRELRAFGNYGPLQVTGCVDALQGKRVDDHKTTARFDPDRYLNGYSWRFYLDLLGADVFRWNVFEIRELKPMVYEVADPQILETYRYPEMHADCMRLAADFYEFACKYMPGYDAMKDAA